MKRKKVVDGIPWTLRVLRVLYRASRPLTRAELVARTGAHPATEITRPVRAWRIRRGLRLEIPCRPNASGRPAYSLTAADRQKAERILGVAA